MIRWFSLRRRLLALLLGGVSLGWLAALGLSYRDAHHEIDELSDAQLVQAAQTLLALAGEYDDDDDIAELGHENHKYQKRLTFQLWDAEGHLLLRSPHAPQVSISSVDGFSESTRDGHWRFYSQWDKEQQLRVTVAEDHQVREDLTRDILGRMLLPALIGLPLLGLWVWLVIRHGLASIDAVAALVARRAPDQSEPLAPASAPSEIRPLITALDDLFARIRLAIDKERSFTADAAHELRTPLAALVTQAQVAARARNEAERETAIAQIIVSGQRASRLVEQLLTLARLDPEKGLALAAVRLDQLAAEICADLGPAALAKDITLELVAPGPITLSANPDMLRILMRNLLDNAVRYTPEHGQVRLDLNDMEMVVRDSGPGIPLQERENVLRRFHRLAGQDTEGSGLGLSIVARIAQLHGARLSFSEGIGFPGLSVHVFFPAGPDIKQNKSISTGEGNTPLARRN